MFSNEFLKKKSVGAHVLSPSGMELGLQRLSSLKYYNVQKWETRFSLGLDVAKKYALYRFSRRITAQLQNWAFLTYLHGMPRNANIYQMQERLNVKNTSMHQEIVVLLLNLLCCSHFSSLQNFKSSFWKIMIFAIVMLFFWRSDIGKCFK